MPSLSFLLQEDRRAGWSFIYYEISFVFLLEIIHVTLIVLKLFIWLESFHQYLQILNPIIFYLMMFSLVISIFYYSFPVFYFYLLYDGFFYVNCFIQVILLYYFSYNHYYSYFIYCVLNLVIFFILFHFYYWFIIIFHNYHLYL